MTSTPNASTLAVDQDELVPMPLLQQKARSTSSTNLNVASPLPRMQALPLEQSTSSPGIVLSPIVQNEDSVTDMSTPTNEEQEEEQRGENSPSNDEEARRRREEEESIALARALMAEEAMASYQMSQDFLNENRDQFSEEDLAALQAAMEEEEQEANAVEGDQPDGGMSYDFMLRLGEQIGDVKTERWSRVAKEKISSLPVFEYDPTKTVGKDENDCEVKCLVCQFSYEKKESLRRLPCNHCFHTECVDQWLMNKDFCPYCRQTITKEESK